jgi:hypothetical protein
MDIWFCKLLSILVFFNQYFRIREPAVWVVSEPSKNRQFMQNEPGKNRWLSDFLFLFFSILENCGNISGFQFFDFWESQLWTLRITLIIVRVSVPVYDNYPIALVKTSVWLLLYPREEPRVLVQKNEIKTISVLLPTCKWNPQSSFGSGLVLIF